MKLLNSRVIDEVQSYLKSMNWAQKEYKGELLLNYLNGVRDALTEKGLTFSLCNKKAVSGYETIYYVLVEQYEDYTDCWSEKKAVMRIYEDNLFLYTEVE